MSHFTVLAIGDDYESNLAPYQEGGMDSVDPEYLEFSLEIDTADEQKYIDNLKDEFEQMRRTAKSEDKQKFVKRIMELEAIKDDASRANFIAEYTGYEQDENENWGYWYNPSAKWDWYTVGGRWDGALLLKDGSHVSTALVRDIDFEQMKRNHVEAITNTYNTTVKQIEETDPSDKEKFAQLKSHLTWHSSLPEGLFDFSQPDKIIVNWSLQELLAHARHMFVPAWAILTEDGEWLENGEMGWFGQSKNEMNFQEWQEIILREITGLAPETRITLIDCHI